MFFNNNRTIKNMPSAYNSNCTPYHQDEFSLPLCNSIDSHKIPISSNMTKVIFVGDINVGKTAIISKFCYNLYNESYKATIGVDFIIEKFEIFNRIHNMQFWDTAGQERFKSIAQSYYRNTDIIVIVFDMTNKASLEATTDWLKNVLTMNSIQKPFIYLVGCKFDLLSVEQIKTIENEAFVIAEGMRAEYWSVSAKTGYNITELFQRIASLSFESKIIQALNEDMSPKETRTIPREVTTLQPRCRCTIA